MPASAWNRSAFTARPSGVAWSDSAPIRAALYSDEQLHQHAVALADSHLVVPAAAPVVTLLTRLREDADVLTISYRDLSRIADAGAAITDAAEWFIDNFHVIDDNIRHVRRDLPQGYMRELPKLGPGFLGGHPRIVAIVWDYIAHTDSLFEPGQLADYIRAYEARKALSLGELWAVAICLRMLLVDNARRLAERVVTNAKSRLQADELADRLLDPGIPTDVPFQRLLPPDLRITPSRAFEIQLLRRLTDQPQPAALAWIDSQLATEGLSREEAIQEEHQREGQAAVTMRNIIRSLRRVDDTNWEDWLESVSLIEAELRRNPNYAALDFRTRNLYRSAIERLAHRSHQQEIDVARAVLHQTDTARDEIGADPGFWLLDEGLRQFEHDLGYHPTWRERRARFIRRLGLVGYLAMLTLGLAVVVLLGVAVIHLLDPRIAWGWLVALALIGLVPASDLVQNQLNRRLVPRLLPTPLPALALADGVPPDLRTLVVVPDLLSSAQEVDQLVDILEVHFLSNNEGELYFAAVTDWTDAPTESMPQDAELLRRAQEGIDRLNKKYGERFFLLHRRRQWNPAEGVWMGWERKRGKLEELNRWLRGDPTTSFIVTQGLTPGPFRYVITLDADTKLPRGSVRQLVGKIAHPLNRAVFNSHTRRVDRGYSILQPRIEPSLQDISNTSLFQRIFSVRRGLDPYAFAVSDLYQDLFNEGSYTGKGIYDIDCLRETMDGLIRPNTILSHDLLEGCYARSGLVNDVSFVEDFPTNYQVEVSRQHRWTRGDWQLLPWIFRPDARLSALGRWKMLDNLRRSLAPIGLVVALLCGTAVLTPAAAAAWFALLAATLPLPSVLALLPGLWQHRRGVTRTSQLRCLWDDLRHVAAQAGLSFLLTAHRAAYLADAIARTLYRLTVSRRHLLEWTSAAAASRRASNSLPAFGHLMWPGLVAPVILLAIAGWRSPGQLPLGVAIAVVWLAAPMVAWRVSKLSPAPAPASQESQAELRAVARRTWNYFDSFVVADDNWLPPDNFQEDPEPVVAHRTSPTNIGMYLLATLAAHDLDWIGVAETVERLGQTVETIQEMEHFRGHLFNWYDTLTLSPLLPRYVSTVDSGNYAAALLTVASACHEWLEQPPTTNPRAGLADGLRIVAEELGQTDVPLTVRSAIAAADAAVAALPEDAARADLSDVDQALAALAHTPGLPATAAYWVAACQASCASLRRDQRLNPDQLTELQAIIGRLEELTRQESAGCDFEFLFDKERDLLAVGYSAEIGQLDDSDYDLLASEARLTSYLAVARDQVPNRHWTRLNRPVVAVNGAAALASWSGSMFEYLMPLLLMRQPPGSLLESSCRTAVSQQLHYATAIAAPVWGISESGYNARDPQLTYQYSPFGVPGLGLVRGLAANTVFAPYATALAAMIAPNEAALNYLSFADLGARARYGYYEAVDFTPTRLPANSRYAPVRTYMAHHQGMTIVAIDNVVAADRMKARFHAEPVVRSAELLLQEPAPREVPLTYARTEEAVALHVVRTTLPPAERIFRDVTAVEPHLHILSNGRLSLWLTSAGGSQIRWQGMAITRWHADPLTGDSGEYLYIRDDRTGRVTAATIEPTPGLPDDYEVQFAEDMARFTRRDGGLTTIVEHRVSAESDAVLRTVILRNDAEEPRDLTLCSYAELALANRADDDAHPVFSRMFIRTSHDEQSGALIATRRRRADSDPQVWAAHVLVPDPATAEHLVGTTGYDTDRRVVLGRARSAGQPRILDVGVEPSGSVGDTLDPVFSLIQHIHLEPESQVTLYLWTVVAGEQSHLLDLIGEHSSPAATDRVGMLAWTQSQAQLHHLGVTGIEAGQFQTLASQLVFASPANRPPQEVLRRARPQSDLWPMGISGDRPILLMRISSTDDLRPVQELIRAFEYWRLKDFAADLVLLNEEASGYGQNLHQALVGLAQTVGTPPDNARPTGSIHLVRSDQVNPQQVDALLAGASVVMWARRGSISQQLAPVVARRISHLTRLRRPVGEPLASPLEAGGDLLYYNGFGGFSQDGTEYTVIIDPDRPTPAPWTNVLANERFGCQVTAEGAGHTWSRNARDNQITHWCNDPVAPHVSEAVYVRDDATDQLITATAAPICSGRHVARHGFGYTVYSLTTQDLHVEQTVVVPWGDPVKLTVLRLTNRTSQPHRYSVAPYAELVLGQDRTRSAPHVITQLDEQTHALLASNPYALNYTDQLVFMDMGGTQTTWTGDRTEFLGITGGQAAPAALLRPGALSGTVGAGYDPCFALQRSLVIDPHETVQVVITLGVGRNLTEVRSLIERYRSRDPREVVAGVAASWRERLGVVQVNTPDAAMNLMLNGWLMYQTLACRMLARAGYYQASGAFGFRDQLQDSMASVMIDQRLARDHLVRAAGRQFREGDVQHWWLPDAGEPAPGQVSATGQGIRTRISDDAVWLAAALERYVSVSGDLGVLDEQVPWLEGPLLGDGEAERFFAPAVSRDTASVYEHAKAGLRHAFHYGSHGLPLMGTGDWNDGMNRVGAKGAGESVWLGWFLHRTLADFLPLANRRGDTDFAGLCGQQMRRLASALEEHGWDGEWYRRAYFDDGTPLGSAARTECRIDSIAQSWAVLSGAADPLHARSAMRALERQLVDPDHRLILLFTEPLADSEPDPGYIRAYPPGVRENGGQYTHGAVWAIFAWAQLGNTDRAYAGFDLLNPITHALTRPAATTYRVEPYVLAADVYSGEPYAGRGGWTWYTGSSGWLYRAGMEAVLGLHRQADTLVFKPCIPTDWPGYSVRYRHGDAMFDIDVKPGEDRGMTVAAVVVDGTPLSRDPDGVFRLSLQASPGTHWVTVMLGG